MIQLAAGDSNQAPLVSTRKLHALNAYFGIEFDTHTIKTKKNLKITHLSYLLLLWKKSTLHLLLITTRGVK